MRQRRRVDAGVVPRVRHVERNRHGTWYAGGADAGIGIAVYARARDRPIWQGITAGGALGRCNRRAADRGNGIVGGFVNQLLLLELLVVDVAAADREFVLARLMEREVAIGRGFCVILLRRMIEGLINLLNEDRVEGGEVRRGTGRSKCTRVVCVGGYRRIAGYAAELATEVSTHGIVPETVRLVGRKTNLVADVLVHVAGQRVAGNGIDRGCRNARKRVRVKAAGLRLILRP